LWSRYAAPAKQAIRDNHLPHPKTSSGSTCIEKPKKAIGLNQSAVGSSCASILGVVLMGDIETKLQQVSGVIKQLDDPKVPRNIRSGSKEVIEEWLLNHAKQLDVRIAMTQNKLEELYEDPNMPPEFGTLILQINTALEQILTEV